MAAGRARAVLRAAGAGLGLALTFLVAVVVGVALHLNHAPLRRVIASRVDAVLATAVRGKVVIDSVGAIDLGGIEEGNVRVFDPAGQLVAAAYGVRARIGLGELVRTLLGGDGPLAVHLTDVSVRAADFDLSIDEAGEVGVQRAFASRSPPRGPNEPPGRGVRVAIDRITIDHAWVHGAPAPGLPIDADVDAIRASIAIETRVAAAVAGFSLVTRGMPHGANARGTGEGHLAVPAPSGPGVGAKVAWNGSVGGIAETVSASIDGEALEATLDAADIPPEAVRALWSASPIDSAATVHFDAKGSLPKLDVHLHTTRGAASLDVTGPVVIGAGQSADLHFDARDVDTHALISSTPISNLSGSGDVSLARGAGGALSGKATVDLAGGHIAGARVPSGKIQATMTLDPKTGLRANGTVAANEPGAPTVLSLRVAPKGRSYELAFEGDTHVRALDAVPRLGPVARGRSDLTTHGVVDFGKGAIDIKLGAEIHGLGHDVLSADHAAVDARVSGTLRAPQIDVTVHGDVLDFGGYKFSFAELEVHGPAASAQVHASLDADGDGTPEISADGQLAIGEVVKIDQIQVHLARARENVAIHVGEVKLAQGEVVVDPIEVDGLGAPLHASFHSSLGAAHVRVQGAGIELARLERVSRLEGALGGCEAAVDVDVTLRRDGADGHVSLGVTKCVVQGVEGGAGALDATFDGRRIAGRVNLELKDVGSIELTSPALEVGGTGPLPESWKKTFGRVKFGGTFDVGKLAARLPRHVVPLDHVRGVITLQGRIERDSPTDDTPGLNLSVTTAGLAVIGPSTRTTGVDGAPVLAPPLWRVDGIDLGLDARIDGDSGFAAIATRLNDAKGQLVAVDLKSGAVPYGAILDEPGQALALLEAVPFNARVIAPPREIEDLPKVLGLRAIRGELGADVSATGTLAAPVVDLEARLGKGRVEKAVTFPLDLSLKAHYDGAHAEGTVIGLGRRSHVLEAHFVADARASDLLHGDMSRWTASANAHLAALPLEDIAAINDRQMSGTLTGDVKLDGWHSDGRASFELDVAALKVGDVPYRAGYVKATVDGKAFDADVHLDQSDGSLDATAHAATTWGRALFPSIDRSHPPSGELTAKRFRAALFLPFVDDSFTQLDGRIDADLKIVVDPDTERPHTQGKFAFSEGRFELASIGGEFHDVKGSATFSPDGTVKVEGVRAAAMSGVVEAAASARLNGFALEGANATLQIPSSSPLLLTVQGAQVGTVEGRANVAVKASGGTTNVKVDIPTLHVELPLTSSRDIQPLGELEGVHIGVAKTGGAFVAERLDAPRELVAAPAGKTIVTTIALGDDVMVRKSTELSVMLSGAPVITIGDSVRASGQVRLQGGKIDVQGKAFDIEGGAVTFQGDPSDPQMVVTASWTAPDGTKVYAELRGTLKNPKVNLRSEPSYSPNEIIALLVYGATDATTPNSGAAAGVAGGAATQPLNRALENMGLGGVSTRVDTSDVTPRADVEVQIARNLSLQIAEVMGVPPPGSNPDVTYVTLTWRFAKAWQTQATVGTAGTTIGDIVWTHRY